MKTTRSKQPGEALFTLYPRTTTMKRGPVRH